MRLLFTSLVAATLLSSAAYAQTPAQTQHDKNEIDGFSIPGTAALRAGKEEHGAARRHILVPKKTCETSD
ncbi:MAG: hypothetical protein H0U98_04830 [Alphaproteobacteria bacterium]|nr:hypothetical protein [Alphaproteobacteria bacterium]